MGTMQRNPVVKLDSGGTAQKKNWISEFEKPCQWIQKNSEFQTRSSWAHSTQNEHPASGCNHWQGCPTSRLDHSTALTLRWQSLNEDWIGKTKCAGNTEWFSDRIGIVLDIARRDTLFRNIWTINKWTYVEFDLLLAWGSAAHNRIESTADALLTLIRKFSDIIEGLIGLSMILDPGKNCLSGGPQENPQSRQKPSKTVWIKIVAHIEDLGVSIESCS